MYVRVRARVFAYVLVWVGLFIFCLFGPFFFFFYKIIQVCSFP